MKREVIKFFKKNISHFEGDSITGIRVDLPEFDLKPRDFIDFAEKDLKGNHSTYKLVNSTSNLKRAVDCELDFLLTFLNLDGLYRKKRLGLDKKLGFFKESGVFDSRSLTSLNKFRNRLEHHYEIPAIRDVEVYFDLVVAFVSICESFVSQIMSTRDICFYFENEKGRAVHSEIDVLEPKIELIIGFGKEEKIFSVNLSEKNNPNVNDILEFAFLLRIHLLLIHLYIGSITDEKFIQNLER